MHISFILFGRFSLVLSINNINLVQQQHAAATATTCNSSHVSTVCKQKSAELLKQL